MKRHVVLFLLSCLTLTLQAQTFNPAFRSVDYLRSGILTGSERDRYYSMRMYSLGLGFQGLIEDQLTDLYRNPAYFNKNEEKLIWGDVVRGTLGSKTLSSSGTGTPIQRAPIYYAYNEYVTEENVPEYDTRIYYYPPTYGGNLSSYRPPAAVTTNATGVRFGYASHFGILARGNHTGSISQINSETEGLGSYYDYQRQKYYGTSTNDNNGLDIQLSYGLSLSHDVSFGLSYTLAYDESPGEDIYNSLYSNNSTYNNYSSDSSWNENVSNQTIARKMASHIFKAGLLYESDASSFEAIATLDLSSADYGYGLSSANHSASIYRYYYNVGYPEEYANISRHQSTSLTDVHDAFSASVSTVRLDFRYFNESEKNQTFSARLGFGVGFISADETAGGTSYYQNSNSYQNQTPPIQTYGNNQSALFSYGLKPTGDGFQVNTGVAWGFHVNNWYLLIGGTAYATHNSFDFDDNQSVANQTTQYNYDTISHATSYDHNSAYHHTYSIGTIQIALPIGVEYEIVKDCFARLGWELSYLRKVDKDQTSENGHRTVSDRINTPTVTLGLGVKIIDDLHVDFLSIGDFTTPTNWNLHIMYSL